MVTKTAIFPGSHLGQLNKIRSIAQAWQQNGVQHRVNSGYFRQLVGKKVDPLLHGTAFNPSEVVMTALKRAATPLKDTEDIDF